jgi:hypothetical protein
MQLGPTSSNGTFRRKYVPTIFDFNQGNRILDTVGAAARFFALRDGALRAHGAIG